MGHTSPGETISENISYSNHQLHQKNEGEERDLFTAPVRSLPMSNKEATPELELELV